MWQGSSDQTSLRPRNWRKPSTGEPGSRRSMPTAIAKPARSMRPGGHASVSRPGSSGWWSGRLALGVVICVCLIGGASPLVAQTPPEPKRRAICDQVETATHYALEARTETGTVWREVARNETGDVIWTPPAGKWTNYRCCSIRQDETTEMKTCQTKKGFWINRKEP